MQATTEIQPHPTATQIQHLCRHHSGHRSQGNQLLSPPSMPQLQVVTPCHCRIQPCAASHVCIFLYSCCRLYSTQTGLFPDLTQPIQITPSHQSSSSLSPSPLSDVLHNAASMTKGFWGEKFWSRTSSELMKTKVISTSNFYIHGNWQMCHTVDRYRIRQQDKKVWMRNQW